ncbi:MAG: hypothetical protein NUV93_03115 [Firmicutes bacterium]|jgi:hypothetical protein|nr:hypothetical protein [Bacillota bacterium]
MEAERRRLVLDAVRAASKGCGLPCRDALDLARRLGVAPAEVGAAADELGVKIVACQLGCFKREVPRKTV